MKSLMICINNIIKFTFFVLVFILVQGCGTLGFSWNSTDENSKTIYVIGFSAITYAISSEQETSAKASRISGLGLFFQPEDCKLRLGMYAESEVKVYNEGEGSLIDAETYGFNGMKLKVTTLKKQEEKNEEDSNVCHNGNSWNYNVDKLRL